MYHVLSYEGNDEARTCQTGISTHSPPLRTTSTNTPCAPISSAPHCSGCVTNRLPLLRRHFPIGEKKATYRRFGQAVLSLQGAVRRSTL